MPGTYFPLPKRRSILDRIDEIEDPKPLSQQIDETPTQGIVADAAKRAGRSMVDQPGAIVQSLGQMADIIMRGLAARGAAEQISFVPGTDPNLMNEALNTPNPIATTIKEVGRQMRKDQAEGYAGELAPDPARDRETIAQVADNIGPLAASIATPGGVMAKTMSGMALNSQSAADDAERELLRRGRSEDEARDEAARQFVLNLPAGALESVGWGRLLGRYGKALEDAVNEKFGKAAWQRVLRAVAEQAAIEGGEEGAQQLAQNAAAKATYDPERKLTEGVGDSMKLGAIMGGGMAGGLQGVAEAADKLDTGRNRPERVSDLEAQQQQLLKGDRAVQMFPTGTKPLPVPDGMQSVRNDRGVFHFNPAKIGAEEILRLSEEGRENELLGLGPASKEEVQRRAKEGEPVATVVERGPNGEELRAAAVTPSTASATREAMEQGKSADSTVRLESMEATLRGRSGIDAMIDEAAAEQHKRAAEVKRETDERDQRQTAAREKRDRLAFHLENAERLLAGEPRAAEVQGAVNALREYVDDNSLGLTLEQRQQAQQLLNRLEPMDRGMREQEKAAADQRAEEAQKRQQDLAAAQKERIAAERKNVAAQADIDPTTGKKRLDRMTDDELAEAAQGGNRQAMAMLERQSQPVSGPRDDLLSVLKKVKLPSEDPTMGSELTDLKNEWVNFGSRQQLFTGKPGSLDNVAERLREQGFSEIQTPADVIEFTKRALRGETVLPSHSGPVEVVDFAQQNAESSGREQPATDSPDPFTGERTFITGSRVPVGAAVRIAERGRAAQVRSSEANAQGTVGLERAQLSELRVRNEGDALVSYLTGRRLPKLSEGGEAEVFEDPENGTVYKAFRPGEAGSLGFRVVLDKDAGVMLDTGGVQDMIEKVHVMNQLGGTPTEIVGLTEDGELLVKQPKGRRNWLNAEDALEVNRDAKLVPVPQSVLPRPKNFGELYIANVDGKLVLVDDLHTGNYVGDTLGRGRIIDLATHTLTDAELNNMPALRDWIATQKEFPKAPGPMEFAEAPAGWTNVSGRPVSEATLQDFEGRLKRIAPGLMMQYRVLTGDHGQLQSMLPNYQVKGSEQAAHFSKRKVLWFLQANLRADAKGMMDERLRRDVLHESTHGWLESLDADTRQELKQRWKEDVAAKDGWLASMQEQDIELRAGLKTDWAEYWAERIAQENSRWAARREGGVAGNRGFASQLAYDFRTWLAEAIDYLRQAFSRTKRYNVDFRAFLNDARFRPEPSAAPAGAAPLPIAAAQKETPSFAMAEDPEQKKSAMLRDLNNLNREIDNLEKTEGSRTALRMLMGERADLRVALDEQFNGWRRDNSALAEGQVVEMEDTGEEAPTEGELLLQIRRMEDWGNERGAEKLREKLKAMREARTSGGGATEQGAPREADTERDAVPVPEREYSERPGIYSEVEGHTQMRQPWTERTWEKVGGFFRGFRGAVPELPAFADDETQEFSRLRQFNKLIKRGTPRVWKESADRVGAIVEPLLKLGRLDPNAYAKLAKMQNRVRQLREEGRDVSPGLKQEIAALNRQVEREPYGLFQKLALYLDLKWRVENLKDDQGNAITQPGNLNVKEINERLGELKQILAASPHQAEIVNALREHQSVVKEIAADLRSRDLTMPEDLQNPFYFPHLVLEKGKDTLDRVKLDTQDDFRGYLMKPVGSNKPIETDYAKAMYYHLVAVGSHNLRSDLVQDYVKPYDKMAEVRQRAKELSKEYGRPVSWREAFATDYAKNGYTLFHPDDKLPLHPEMTVNRDTLARRLGVILTEAPLQQQLADLGLRGIKLLPEDITEALAAGDRETWILPDKVAEGLHGMMNREGKSTDSVISKPIQLFQGLWKKNILFAPWNYPRYEFNNTVADIEKMFSVDPEVFRRLPDAAREVRQFIEEGKGGRDVHEAFKLGVLDSVTAAEVNDLTALRQFEKLKTSGDNMRDVLKRASTLFLAGKRSTMDVSKLREATFRFAKFKADLDRMRNGARPVYAGAYWRDIDAIKDSRKGANDANYHKAAEISLATFGDYNNISVTGQELRRYLIPFYSWLEINFKYHANLFRNLKDMAAAGEVSKAEAAKTGAKAAAVFTRKAAAGMMLRLALPYLAATLWNNSGDRDELEETLSAEDRRRFHIILGKDERGKTRVIYGQTAFSDVMKWFGGPDAARQATDYMSGRTDLGTAFSEWMHQFPRDFVNNLFQVGPAVKIAYTLGSKKSTFPDVTDQRTIPAYDLKWNILGQATDQFTAELMRRALDKDYLAAKDVGDWAQQTILQVRKRDPEQWAFYEIKDKAAQYLEEKTGRTRSSDVDAPDQQVLRNFRRSIYRGDVENAVRFYDRLLELGYTAERFKASIRSQDPLSELPKDQRADFVAQLSPFERRQLTRAYEFYSRMSENRGAENALFPSERVPAERRALYTPRHERLQQEMGNAERLEGDALTDRAARELKRSLRPSLN